VQRWVRLTTKYRMFDSEYPGGNTEAHRADERIWCVNDA
jgi:hypothetical protein